MDHIRSPVEEVRHIRIGLVVEGVRSSLLRGDLEGEVGMRLEDIGGHGRWDRSSNPYLTFSTSRME